MSRTLLATAVVLLTFHSSVVSGQKPRFGGALDQMIAEADSMPGDSEEDLRWRLHRYVDVGRALSDFQGDFGISDADHEDLPHYRDIVRSLALRDARDLYAKYIERSGKGPSSALNEDEETLYAVWLGVSELDLKCAELYGNPGCTQETMYTMGENAALLLVMERGGLLDRMRSDRYGSSAANRINMLERRWKSLWKRLPLTAEEKFRLSIAR